MDAIVVPVADEEYGAVPVAFLELEPGVSLNAHTIAQRLAEDLPRYKIPRHVLPWPAKLERPDAKLNRAALADLARALLARSG
jgi:acyl-CoA synthetase (AMP-forming)/AMP-acid ligase II